MAIRPRQEMCMGDLQGAIDSPQNSLPQPWYENQGHDDGNPHTGRREEEAPDSFPGIRIHICPLFCSHSNVQPLPIIIAKNSKKVKLF